MDKLYIYCIPGTPVRRMIGESQLPKVEIDFSVWKLLSIVDACDLNLLYAAKEKAIMEPENN